MTKRTKDDELSNITTLPEVYAEYAKELSDTTTLPEVYAEYAKRVGHEPLTDAEKKQAFLDTMLAGKLIWPFVCFD